MIILYFTRGCLDGYAGFFIAHLSGALTQNVFVYQDIPSTTKIPPNIDNKHILIIDVAYRKEILEQLFKYASTVVYIDHHVSVHETAIKLAQNVPHVSIIYDITKSGCTLTWSYFNKTKPPLFLRLIEDNDIGQWKYNTTKPFIFGMQSYYKLDIDLVRKWDRLLDKTYVKKMIKRGKIIQKFNDHLVDINLPKHTRIKFPSNYVYNMDRSLFAKVGQYIAVVYNGIACPSITDLSREALKKMDCDLFIAWTYNIDRNDYVLSFRSIHVDVAKIAALFGGGGHKLAAACSINAKVCSINDIFDGQALPRQ